uniref:Uncharacterized protein n=1 Tax=Photinus pyralis TaxID=7054 RepID=A0A1Y1LEY3_PHOPY
MVVVKNVTIQTVASHLLNAQYFFSETNWISIDLSATTIMLAKTHLGRLSKTGPIQSNTARMITHDTTEASCVTPPTVCWIMVRESEAVIGMHEKNEPKKLLKLSASSSWLASTS